MEKVEVANEAIIGGVFKITALVIFYGNGGSSEGSNGQHNGRSNRSGNG